MSDACGLYDMLLFREKKAEIQRQFLKNTKKCSVISFGLNIPGPEKTGELIYYSFLEGLQCIGMELKKKEIEIIEKIYLNEKAGYAAIYLVKADVYTLKKDFVRIEDNHMLGRLFDIDVLSKDGLALSREQIGAPARKCLICGEDAKVCARSRRHSLDELNNKVVEIIKSWRESNDSGRLSI